MITNEEKKIYEDVKKAYFMYDFLKRVKERKETGSCLEGLTVDELKKNKIFLDKAYDYFRQTEVKDRTYNDILDSVIETMEFQVKRDVYFKNVWKFISCNLDDEHYAEAEYDFFDTMTEGKRSCFENLPFDPIYSGVEGSIEYKETFSFDNKPSSFRLSQTQENCFYVTEVHPYEATGEYACIWHHAYEGVSFEVVCVGSYDECMEYARNSAKAVYADFEHGEYDEFTDQVIVDTENEWQVWDVVKLPD